MAFKSRAEFEDALTRGQAFARLETTPDYAITLAQWIEEELQRPDVIDVSAVQDPNLLKEYFWMLKGKKDMLYALCEQIERWRSDSRLSPSDAPTE